MASYQLLLYFHILLMVFWLGTDIGVFIAGLHFIDPKLPLERRRGAMDVGFIIDRFPRVCFVAILPIGAQLAWLRGLLVVRSSIMDILWACCLMWMTAVVAGMLMNGRPVARLCHSVERVFQVTGLVLFGGGGFALLASHAEIPAWLAGKMIAFGLVCLFAILLERAFEPVMPTFEEIVRNGSAPELEGKLRNSMYRSYLWVLSIYAAVIVAGFLGTVKP